MKNQTLYKELLTLMDNMNNNVKTYCSVKVNDIDRTVFLVYKRNIHTNTGIIIPSDLDTDLDVVKLIKAIKTGTELI